MKKTLVGLFLAACTGCATMDASTVTRAVPHETALQADARNGVQVAAGPLTLQQAQLVPTKGSSGSALLWASKDGSCPTVSSELALAKLTPQEAFFGPQSIGQGEYLCAQQTSGDAASKLDWFTAQ